MRHLLIVAMLIMAAIGGYFVIREDGSDKGTGVQYTAYSNPDLGIEFNYRTGPKGYVLQESSPVDKAAGLVKALVLMRAEDAARGIPQGGEGPVTLSVHVFTNSAKQRPQAWADAHTQYSNINLKMGEVAEVVIGGANAIRYKADGLYVSDNVVVAHGDSVYVISGSFLDEGSDIRRDFQPLVDSVKFIPKAGQ